MFDDTAAAISTAPGRAGIAVVRVSGPAASAIGRAIGLPDMRPRVATYAKLRHPQTGEMLDRVVATFYRGPDSYTGDDMLELSCHGGALVPNLVLDAALAAGAREAEAGEFTRRAYMNGKLDLVQVEATIDLIDARSPALHHAALFQLDGGLSDRITKLRGRVLELLALIAYEIDFPGEDDGPVPPERIDGASAALAAAMRELLRDAPEGELLREGALTVVAGRPNSGKSTLFNALLGEQRAIVTRTPGTTRDAIEALLSIDGYPFRLVDTAGIRKVDEEVERIGIEVASRYSEAADVLLFCAETNRSLGPDEREFLLRFGQDRRVIRVRTKSDLAVQSQAGSSETGSEEVRVSASTGEGLGELKRRLADAAFGGIRSRAGAPLLTRRRHARCLEEALGEVEAFDRARGEGLPMEIAAVSLETAAMRLDELLGAIDTEEVLGAIFTRFCVGK